MSLSDQSQQWYPTSVQVTVLQARSLRIKGKNGTNDAYAIMQVAKDKFSTSVAEKSVAPVWKEEATFELPLFHNGNTDNCTLHVNVMHRALMGPDKLLGRADINLWELSELKSRNKTDASCPEQWWCTWRASHWDVRLLGSDGPFPMTLSLTLLPSSWSAPFTHPVNAIAFNCSCCNFLFTDAL
uniref:C2 domain-containing protein n=1 Tax=Esox lucius TaxID=8010 RepID=A0AAY5KPI9_ESOLU